MSDKRLGMLIDLSVCIGCNACTVACRQENETPLTKFNTWVESWDAGIDGRVTRANLPKLCTHCANPACVKVCPTGASYQAEDGTVQVDPERCIGCKYCMAACPYQVRYQLESGEVDKCTFCHHRTTEGLLPACVSTCVTTSRMFGDLNDPDSDISKKLAAAGDKAKGLMEDRGMEPRVYYIGLDETLGAEQLSAVHKGGNVLRRREEGNA